MPRHLPTPAPRLELTPSSISFGAAAAHLAPAPVERDSVLEPRPPLHCPLLSATLSPSIVFSMDPAATLPPPRPRAPMPSATPATTLSSSVTPATKSSSSSSTTTPTSSAPARSKTRGGKQRRAGRRFQQLKEKAENARIEAARRAGLDRPPPYEKMGKTRSSRGLPAYLDGRGPHPK